MKIPYIICYSLLVLTLRNVNAQTLPTPERPKLVVGIVVDQMRWDYLYRYCERYGEGGFKRLLREGFSNENTYIPHLPTITAIGHTCVYTGSVPAIHGITGNDFLIEDTGEEIYCTADKNVNGLISHDKGEQMSPRNLLASTVTDELKLATNGRSKVIGIAIKDRASILPAGHMANAAYWMGPNAQWTSSTYYMRTLPQWVLQYNQAGHAQTFLQQGWSPLYPIATYIQSDADNNPYEGKISGTDKPTLPIAAEVFKKAGPESIRNSPFGNSYTLDFAKEAIRQEQLGHNPAHLPDFLTISLSSTDAIGHRFGINAIETEDTYLRLDHDLSTFFTFLDQTIGSNQYLVFLTADHGAAHNTHYYIDHKGVAGFLPGTHQKDSLNIQLKQKFGADGIITSLDNDQVHLNRRLLKEKKLSFEAIKEYLIGLLNQIPGIMYAVDIEKAAQTTLIQPIKERIINSYQKDRSGAIQLIMYPQWTNGSPDKTGTGHGDWNSYDAHIPLLWMGWGIGHGSNHNPVSMADIAPTVSSLLHIQEPNGTVGKSIADVIKSRE